MTESNFTDADLEKLSANAHRDYAPVTVDLATELLAARTTATKVAGYTAQPDAKVALVNEFKADEERLLRKLDTMQQLLAERTPEGFLSLHPSKDYDHGLVTEARKTLTIGFMLLNRAVFQPRRISLPEDEPTLAEAAERSDLP